MEGKQTAKKRRSPAFLAALAVAALFCVGRPASAQFLQVAPNGVGDLLIFQYWFTVNPQDDADTRDTLVALVNPFSGQAQTFVHFKVHEGVGSNDVRDFTVCLSGGDVWTAAITAGAAAGTSSLVVGNAGSCDSAVVGAGFTPPPAVGQVVPMAATFGYIEAYTMESPSLTRLTGGDDRLFGVATPVNVSAGFSSSYNAVAIVGFNAINETATVLNSSGSGTFQGAGSSTAVTQALAREGGVDKEILLTRWTANPTVGSETQIVLTFPGGRQPGTEPLSAYVFDENENVNFSPRTIFLPREVNTCTFETDANANTTLTCAGSPNTPLTILGTGGTFTAGWVRILNNNVGVELDQIDALPITRFPVIGLVFSSFLGDSVDFDQSFNLHWVAIRGSGGSGGTAQCQVGAAGIGCSSYNIADPISAPWFRPPVGGLGDLIVPGNNVQGALNRTGTSVP